MVSPIRIELSTPLPKRRISEPDFFTARNLCVFYGKEQILRDASFAVPRGSLCGLLGPNGAGKSTLFKCCMNFTGKTSGEISVGGQSTCRLSPPELAKIIAYVPQEHKQAFPFTVREIVSMGRSPRMSGFLRLSPHDYAIVDRAIEQMGIAHLAQRPASRLSGGQRQLALIARALAQEAPLMLLDEPTAALDFNNQIIVWRALHHIAASGVTVLVCCHDPNHIMWFCDHVLVMKHGEIIAQATPEEISRGDFLSRLYGEHLRCGQVDGRTVIYPFL